MILRKLANIREYCEKAEPHLGVFVSEKWLSAYGKALQAVGIFRDEHQMIGGFFFVKARRFGMEMLKLPPYTPHCGLFFSGQSKNLASQSNFSKEVMDEVSAFIEREKAGITVLAFPYTVKDLQPFIWKGFKVIPNYTYLIDLRKEMEEIRSHFDSKHRNAINKAVKEGVEVKPFIGDRKEVMEFFSHSLSLTGANVYNEELAAIISKATDDSNSFILEAFYSGSRAGMVMCVFDSSKCYYLLGGVEKDSGVQGVNNLLVLRSIELAKEKGCSVFDFEGSMLQGVEKFFRGFGPELVPYYTVNKAGLLTEMLLKFYKRSIF